MAKVLSISSQVIYGHVGNSTSAFVLQSFGHEVLAAPTILLSNRPGYEAIAGARTPPESLDAMLEAIAANGWFDDLDVIATGYLPSRAHVELCARWVERLRRAKPGLYYLCDPIVGDEPCGIYVEEAAAKALGSELLPQADAATPNVFELSFFSRATVVSEADAISAARGLGPSLVLVTSAPADDPGMLANLLVERGSLGRTVMRRRNVLAHGTGDFFAAQFLARKLAGVSHTEALSGATLAMELVLAASQDRSELALIETQRDWMRDFR